MQDICNFIPLEANSRDIEYHHFVYEVDIHKLAQPFVQKNFYMYLVFKGEATLRTNEKTYPLKPGTLFITFPYQQHELVDYRDFAYLYITFSGNGANKILNQFSITPENMVFHSFGHLTEFWMNSIRRVNPSNIHILTESVLLHTLSYIDQCELVVDNRFSAEFNEILAYIHNNYADTELSVSKLADIFCFNKKYLSSLFAKNIQIKFTDYLTQLRIEQAIQLMKEGVFSVSELALRCGFSDPFYFSKVFKRLKGVSPSKYKR